MNSLFRNHALAASAFRRLRRSLAALPVLAALLLASAFAPRDAQAFSGICNLSNQSASPAPVIEFGQTTLSFDIIDQSNCALAGGMSYSITITNGTASGTLISPNSPGVMAPGPRTIVVQGSATSGQFTVTLNCTGNCSTTNTLTWTVNVENVGLSYIDPAAGSDSVALNTPRALEVYWGSSSIPQPGNTIGFSVVTEPSGGAAILTPGSDTTDGAGLANISFTGTVPGNYTIRASAPPGCTFCSPMFLDFSLTVSGPSLNIVSGDGQTVHQYDRANDLVVELLDGGGVPIVGATVDWTVDGISDLPVTLDTPTSTVTNGAGQASIGFTTGGPSGTTLRINATAPDFGLTVDFDPFVTITSPCLNVVSGNNQSGEQGTTATDPLVVYADNECDGSPAVGAPIAWSVISGDGTTSSLNTSTDINGNSQVDLDFGTTPGPVQVQAEYLGATAFFDLTVNDSYTLTRTSAAAVTVRVGEVTALTAQYLKNNLAYTGQTVSWGASGSPSPGLSSTSTALDGNGDTSVDFSSDAAGVFTVTATGTCDTALPNCPPPSVTYLVTVVDRQLAVDTGNFQIGPRNTALGAPLTVLATDDGIPVADLNIDWSITGDGSLDGGGTTATSVTDGSGIASINATLGSLEGSYTITATRSDDPTISTSFTATAEVSRALAVNSGDGQTGHLGTTLSLPLEALATDDGSPVGAGIGVDWVTSDDATLIGAPSTTDASGLTSITVQLGSTPGPITIFANRQDEPDAVASFTVTAADFNLSVEQGDGQNGPKNTTLPTTLMVHADNSGVFVDGVTINWEVVSGSGTLTGGGTTATSVTSGGGDAEIELTLGNAPGTTVTVSAHRADNPGTTVLFTASIDNEYVVTAQTPASGTVNVGETFPMTVRYELNGSPYSNAVDWNASGGALDAASTTGDTNGDNDNGFTSASGGVFSVTADGVCPPGPGCPPAQVLFTVTVVDRQLVYGSAPFEVNPNQVVQVVAQALDDGVAAAGVNVDWTVTGDGSPAGSTVATDGSGNSTFNLTIGTSVGTSINLQAVRQDNPSAVATFTVNIVAPNLTVISGDGQSGLVGATAPAPLVVELNDGTDSNNPIAGATIDWSVLSGPAQLASATSLTDGSGQASMTFDFGASAGASTIEARDQATGLAVASFTASAMQAGLTLTSGDGQTALTSNAMPALLEVTADNDGIPAVGGGVDWTVTSGDALISLTPTNTGPTGLTQSQLVCGPTPGAVTARATRADANTVFVDFTATCIPARTLTIDSGDGQNAPAGTALPLPLVVLAQDDGSPASAIGIDWLVVSGDATVGSPSTSTDGSGLASNTVTFGPTSGAVVVSATRSDDASVTVSFNLTADLVRTLVVVSGDGQADVPGATLAQDLVVHAQDGGSDAAGVGITWNVAGDAAAAPTNSITDAGGLASTTITLGTAPGPVLVTAIRDDDGSVTAAFNLVMQTPLIAIVSGDGQSGPTGTTLPSPLVVSATNDGSAVADGFSIDWQVMSGDATVGAASSTTTGGNASIDVTFGPTPGAVVVRATRPDTNQIVEFNLTSTLSRTLAITAGDGQSGATNSTLPTALEVLAQDNGSDAAGINIVWSVTAGDASLATGGPTAANGRTTASVTFGATAGAVQVRAERVDDPSAFVVFNLNSADRGLVITGGDGQTTATNAVFPTLFTVESQLGGSPEPGVSLTWTTTIGVASINVLTNPTDGSATGVAEVTCGNTAGAIQISASRDDEPTVQADFNANCTLTRTLDIASGDGQAALPGAALPSPLVVHVRDNGVDVSGLAIDWLVLSGDATVGPGPSVSDASGLASQTVQFGSTPGAVQVQASRSDDNTVLVVFNLTVVAPAITIASGDGQSGPVGTTLASPLVVSLTNDGSAVADGTVVDWSVTAGDASVSAATSATSGGDASIDVTFGASPGPVTVRAARADAPGEFVDFSLTATSTPQLAITGGDGQSGLSSTTLAAPLAVNANDSGVPAAGVTINWLVTAGDATLASASSVTDAAGDTSVDLILGTTAGPVTVNASRADAPSASVDFNATVVLAQLAPFSGAGQSGPTGTTLPDAFVFRATNDGIAVAGVPVTWSVVGDATLSSVSTSTDGAGMVSAIVTLGNTPGPVTVNAQRDDSPAASASIGATATLTQDLIVHDGNFQSGPTGTTLPLNLVVQALDNGVGVDGVNTSWSVLSGDATLGSCCGTTAGGGYAGVSITFGSTPGPVQVQAVRDDVAGPVAIFDLTATAVKSLAIASGDGQSGMSGTTLPLAVFADDSGVAAAGVTIEWNVVSGDASQGALTSVTDAAGNATMDITLGATPGPVQVTANRADEPSAIVTFTLTSNGEPVLSIVSGDGQAGYGGQTSGPLVVELLDGAGNPLAGQAVDWQYVGGSGLATPTTFTDASGRTSNVAVFGGGFFGVSANHAGITEVVFDLQGVTANLSIVSGNGQTGEAGTALPLPLVVEARDDVDVAPGIALLWSVDAGDAIITSADANTDGAGQASATVSFGATPGPVVITALRNDGSGKNVQFALNSALISRTLLVDSDPAFGSPQTGSPGAQLAMRVTAEDDASPVAGVGIDWLVTSGDATLTAGSGITDAAGQSLVYANIGPSDGPRVVTVSATRQDDASAVANFTFNILAINRELFLISGDGQNGYVGTTLANPLVVEAKNDGLPTAGVSVDWVVSSGDATVDAASTVTDAGGLAQVAVSLGATAGPVVVTATRSDAPASPVSFTLNAVALPPSQLSITDGNFQVGLPGSSGDVPLTVTLVDGFGVPMANEPIQWAVTSGDIQLAGASSLTDASGVATMPFTFGTTVGTAGVQATALSGSLAVDFGLEVAGGSILPASGNGQSGPVGTTLPLPLTVKVSLPAAVAAAGAGGGTVKPQGLAGVPVTWVVTAGGGTLSATSTVTDANGESAVDLTLGAAPGVNTVTATTAGGSATFTATAFIPTGTLAKVSGDNQTLPTNTQSAPLVVELRDAGNQPVAGVTIDWTADNAVLASATSVTDAAGRASNTATVELPGAASVSASSANPSAGPVTFAINGGVANLPGLTPVQEEIADAIDNLCPALAQATDLTPGESDLFERCKEIVDAVGLDPDAVIDALDQLIADMALVQANASLLALQSQFQNLKARIAALRSGTQGSSFGGLALAGSGGSVSLAGLFTALAGEGEPEVGSDFSRWGWFVSGTLGRGESDPGSITPEFDYDINGLTAGVDYRYSDSLIIGGSLGYTRQDTEAGNGNGSLDTSGWTVSAYGTWYQQDSWYVDGVLTFGQNDFSSSRRIQYTLPLPGGGSTTVDQVANSSSSGDVLQAAFTFGRDFQKGAWGLGVYGRVLYSRLGFDEAREQLLPGAGSGLGLAIETRDLVSLATVLGGKATYTHSASWGVLMPHFEFEWEHETKDDPASVQAYFLNDPTNTPIVITGDPMDNSYFRLGLGLSMVLTNGRSGFAYYEKMLGRDGQSQDNLSIGFRMEF